MKRLLLLLLPALLFAGQPRYARLGDFDGNVEVQLHPADPWSAAERNLTLRELAWLRTGPSSRLEIELDEGSAWRLGADSQMEVSDYSLLSSGQRLTVLSLDHGVAYFTGEPLGKDTLMLVAPGVQVTLIRGARVRIEAGVAESHISVIEGTVRLSCPVAEIDLREGQMVRVEPGNTARFSLEREIPAMDLDRWSEERDKVLAAPASMHHVAQRFGLADLDAAGEWLSTDIGSVWRPRVNDGWEPFQNGRWRWYDGLGYNWVSADAWGWLPYHYGRWTRKGDLGWVWSPTPNAVYKPGDVYWLYGLGIAGWGPLAPGEYWSPSTAPRQFLTVNTTWAAFAQDAMVIDPAGFTGRPKEPLAVAVFRAALPSPAFLALRLEAVRAPLRVGSTHFAPVLPGTTFQDTNDVPPPTAPPVPPPIDTAPPSAGGPPTYPPDPGPAGPPMQTTYPVPDYTGIIVINPPDHPDYSRRNPNAPRPLSTPAPPKATPPQPSTTPTAPSAQTLPGMGSQPPSGRPTGGPGIRPIEPPKVEPPHQTKAEPKPPAGREEAPRPAPTPAPVTTHVEAPKPAPTVSAPQPPHVEAPRPSTTVSAPKIEAPKVESKVEAKTDTSTAKKQ